MSSKKNKIWIWTGVGLLVLLVVLSVIAQNRKVELFVSAEKPALRDLVELVTANGTITPEVEVKISSEVSGEIINLYVKEGDSVKKGDLLLLVNPDISESNVERAKASVDNARANLEASKARVAQAKARQEQARLNFERNKKLYEDKVISTAEFDQIRIEYETAKAELLAAERAVDAAHYTVKSLESTLSGEQKTLQRTSIFSPMDGIVSRLNVEQGERVVGTMQMTGTELLRIADFTTMELSVDVGESDIIRVSVGDTAEIEVDAYDDRKFIGIVKEVANSSKNLGLTTGSTDQVTNFVVKITILRSSYEDLLREVPGKVSPFLPGMSGMADIRTRTARQVISVPIESVTLRDAEDSSGRKNDGEEKKDEVVFLLRDGKAEKVVVKTGIQDSRHIEITSGLDTNTLVITGPYNLVSRTLKDRDLVQLKEKKDLFKEKD